MTAPVPEETNAAYDLDEAPPGEHGSDLPEGDTADDATSDEHDDEQVENAETSLDQPSQ